MLFFVSNLWKLVLLKKNVRQTSLCSTEDKKINIKKKKQFLSMAMGKISIHTDIVHDTVSPQNSVQFLGKF